jgi:hypothetical protein
LNAYREFEAATADDVIWNHIDTCQAELHSWGRANQVCFDPSKESRHILSRTRPKGGSFKLLGVIHDPKLIMDEAIHQVVNACRWKRDSLLRCQRHFTGAQLVDQYKSQILSYIEYRTPTIYHACSSLLQPLDRIQEHVLEAAGLSKEEALFECNLAPLSARRDMAMLGVVHRTVLGRGPKQFREFFALTGVSPAANRHRLQVREYCQGSDAAWTEIGWGSTPHAPIPNYIQRSALGLCTVYNLLPAGIVEGSSSVSCFQAKLQLLLKEACKSGCQHWDTLLSPRWAPGSHPLH